MIITYSISNDTLNGILEPVSLTNEIRKSTILIALEGVTLDGDDALIEFKANISAAEELTLDAVVAAHEGRRAVEDAQKFQVVDNNQTPISSIDDNGIKRLALDVGLGTLVGPQGDQGAQGDQGIQGVPGVPGGLTSYTYNESEAESTTTSNNYQQKLKLTTPSVTSGNYLIQWYCEITSTNKDGVSCIVELDDTTTIAEIEDDRHHSEDFFKPFSGLKQVTLSSGVHEIDIDYKREGGTAKIRRARISITGVN